MTQPPLSLAIQGLERDLGALLFLRTQRSVGLSPAGAALLPRARRLLAEADELPRVAQAAAAGRVGQLRLAFVSSIAYGPLPQWLSRFRAEQPGVRLALREATLDVQLEAFERGDLDAGFVLHAPGAVPDGFESLRVLEEAMWLAMPEGGTGAARRPVRPAALAPWPLLVFPRPVTPSLFDAIFATHRALGWTPTVAQEAIQMQTLVNLVSAGMGVAWVPESVTRLQRPGVVYRRVAGADLRAQTSLIWRPGAAPVVLRFVEQVRQQRGPGAAGRRQSGRSARA
jgi:DNA-binding transcriptional LysR family regulator